MTPSEALTHARCFDRALANLNAAKQELTIRETRLMAIAIVHAAIFWLNTNQSRRKTYYWLQAICDDMAKKIVEEK